MEKNKKKVLTLKKAGFRALIISALIGITGGCATTGGHYTPTKRNRSYRNKLIILPTPINKRSLRPYVVNGQTFYPLPRPEGFVQTGLASWYGKGFHGNKTASGEIYNMYKKSAAHKTLPLGTYVRVLNLTNGKQTVVKINDRGPFVKGRIIDLSYAAAKEIGLVGPGVAKVKITVLGRQVDSIKTPTGIKPVVSVRDLNRGCFSVQVGAFSKKENALRLSDRLKVLFRHVEIEVYRGEFSKTVYRVRVSRAKTLEEAARIEKKLEAMGFREAFIVRL